MNWEFFLTIGVVVIIALIGLYGVFYNLKRARIIEDTPTSKIRSASQGYTELNGLAKMADDIVLAGPLTNKPCLWYRYKIERYERRGKSSSWRTVENNVSQQVFALEDPTGICYIYPDKAELSSSWKDVWKGSSRHPLQQQTQGMLSFLSLGNYRYTEERIHKDDFLYALGMFQTANTPSHEQKTQQLMADLLSDWKQDYDQLVNQYDSSGDGILDMQEWEKVREAAKREAQLQVNNSEDEHIQTHVLVKPPTKKPFIISNKDPKELTSRFRWMAAGMASLFIGASGLTVHLLNGVI